MGHFLLVRGMHKLFAASCCDSGGRTRDGRGTNRQRKTEGGEKRARKSELFSQTWSFSLTKLRAPKPQCCLVPKGTTLQKLTSKQGWRCSTNKQTLEPYSNSEKQQLYGLKLHPALKHKTSRNALKLVFDEVVCCSAAVEVRNVFLGGREAERASSTHLLIYRQFVLDVCPTVTVIDVSFNSSGEDRGGGSRDRQANPNIHMDTYYASEVKGHMTIQVPLPFLLNTFASWHRRIDVLIVFLWGKKLLCVFQTWLCPEVTAFCLLTYLERRLSHGAEDDAAVIQLKRRLCVVPQDHKKIIACDF